jgi:hypothetical protein
MPTSRSTPQGLLCVCACVLMIASLHACGADRLSGPSRAIDHQTNQVLSLQPGELQSHLATSAISISRSMDNPTVSDKEP